MLVPLVLVVLGGLGWWLIRQTLGFPAQFASLLDESTQSNGLLAFLSGRAIVGGRYRVRAVTMTFERADEHRMGSVVVRMRVDAPDQPRIRARSSSGTDRADGELERALYVLEGRHALKLWVDAGWLCARWQPAGLFIFPGRFEDAMWRDVLETMWLASSRMERRPAGAVPSRSGVSPLPPAVAPTMPEAGVEAPTSFRGGLPEFRSVALLLIGSSLPLLLTAAAILPGRGGSSAVTVGTFAAMLLATGVMTLAVSLMPAGWLVNESALAGDEEPTAIGGWLWLLLATIVAVPLVMVQRLVPLVTLTRDVLAFLEANDVWNMAAGAGELSGLVYFPIVAVLSVPGLELAVAAGVVIACTTLLARAWVESPRFPRAFVTFVVLTSGLAVSTEYAAHAMSAAADLVPAAAAGQPDSGAVAAAVDRYGSVLRTSAHLLAWVAIAFAAWSPVFFRSKRVRTTFRQRPGRAPGPEAGGQTLAAELRGVRESDRPERPLRQ